MMNIPEFMMTISKYNIGDLVCLNKIFTPEDGGKMFKPEKDIYAKVIRVDKAVSFGFSYELKALCNTYLGGIMYWESDIARLVSTVAEIEEEMWKTWGDQ